MKSRLMLVAALAPIGLVGSSAAQIPTQARSLNSNAPRMLVATPYTPRAEDSSAAVAAGIGLRERLTRHVSRDYRVVTRQQMNDALETFGYPADALLEYHAARTLAQGVTAPIMVMPYWQRVDGRHRLAARLIATGASRGAAGHVVVIEQQPGQDPKDVGEKVADDMRPLFRAYGNAVECYDNAASDRAKAIEAGQKALRDVPNFGPAEYCLGAIAQSRDSTSQEALGHFMNAVKGDPQSIPAYAAMGSIYFRRNDSVKVVETYQTMLRVDPLDQTLRENAFKLFQAFGRPSAAEEVADEGIARDPANTDWYDLKSNACLQQEKFDCAVEELERLYQVDSTAADTSFYSKINYAARLAEDTTAYVKWATKGVEKYPDHIGMLEDAARAYGWAGDADRTIAVTRRLLAVDPGNFEPLRGAIVRLSEAGRAREALEFLPTVKNSGDPDLQNVFGQVMVNAASQVAGTNLPLADSLSQAGLDAGMNNERLVAFANYFIGLNLFEDVKRLSASVRESRSCQDARTYQTVLERIGPALTAAKNTGNPQIVSAADQMLAPVPGELRFVREFIPTVCR